MAVADHEIKEMREKRVALHAEYSGIVQKATTEKRGFSAEENERLAKIQTDMTAIKGVIDAEERSRAYEKELAETPTPTYKPGEETRGAGGETDALKAEVRAKFQRFLVEPRNNSAQEEYRGAYDRWLQTVPVEQRGLTMGQPTQAGYLVAPEQFSDAFIQGLDANLSIRGLATVEQLRGAHSLGVCKLGTDVGDFSRGTEVSAADEDTAMTVSKRELKPQPFTKLIKVSKTLLRHSGRADMIVRDRMAYAGARTQEKKFLNGTGLLEALGVFTASNDGISTSRDKSTGNTSTAITYAGLVSAKMALKEGHRNSPNTRWIFHADAISQILKLVDDQNRPIWQPDMRLGAPDHVLNVPVVESEFAPNTFTTGLYVGIIGNFQYYWIAESLQIEMAVASELYMATNQNGYFCRMEFDGQPVLEEAFCRVKLA